MPNSEEYINSLGLKNLIFSRMALTDFDGEEKCFYPENKNYISGSLRKENVSWQELSEEYFMVECHKLKTFMEINGHSHIDLLKICVEGAEFEVIEGILRDGLDIDQIAIAFCGRGKKGMHKKEKRLYRSMINAGYECLPYQLSHKITFIQKSILH